MISRITLLLFIGLAWGQNLDKDLAKCASIVGVLERLECYDQLAKANNLFGTQKVSTNLEGTGDWDIKHDANPIDDSETVTLTLYANSGTDYLGNKVYLIIRCKSSEIALYIGWKSYLGSSANVLTRVGTEKAETKNWSLSTDSQATFSTEPTELITRMLNNQKFVAQVTPYNSNPITAIFNISGIENAIKPIKDICGENFEDLSREDGEYYDGKKHGLWTYFGLNGNKIKEGQMVDGKEEGVWTFYDENGIKWGEAEYKSGELDGLYTQWDENGQKKSERTYRNGKMDGLWTTWMRMEKERKDFFMIMVKLSNPFKKPRLSIFKY